MPKRFKMPKLFLRPEAKEVRVPAWGKDLRIPAPEGFWTLEDDNPVAKFLKLEADADTNNKTVGMWARTESGLWDDIQCASVKVAHAFYGKRVSLSTFENACEAVRKEYEGLSQKFLPVANKMAESISRKAANQIETNISMSIDDVRFLPPYAMGRDRICFTVIRKERHDIGGEKSVSLSVTSGAMLWIRGTVFNLFINNSIEEKAADLEAAVSATREKLSKWIIAVETVNGRSSLESENAVAKSDPGCLDSGKRQKGVWSLNWGKILVWTVIGAICGLFSSLFKKKKGRSGRNGHEEYDDKYDEEDDEDEEYYARSRRRGKRRSNRRSCLVVLLLIVATVLAVFLIGLIAMYREGKFDKPRNKSTLYGMDSRP